MTPLVLVAVLLAGAAGAVLRYVAGLAATRSRLPWTVLAVNVTGSFLAGIVLGLGVGEEVRLVVVTGFAGGLTTFSTLSVETIQLLVGGRWRAAAVSVAANLVLGIGAAAGGFLLGSALG